MTLLLVLLAAQAGQVTYFDVVAEQTGRDPERSAIRGRWT